MVEEPGTGKTLSLDLLLGTTVESESLGVPSIFELLESASV